MARELNWRRLSEGIAEKGFLSLVFFLPLTFVPGLYWPFDTPKVVLLRLGTLLVLGAWAARWLGAGEIRVARPPAAWPVLAYLGAFALATVTSISPTLSLFGEGARNDGLLTIANLVLLYFLAPNVLTTPDKLERCARLVITSGAIVAVFGIVQYFFIFRPFWMAPMGGRASSVLSNPDFLFSYLALLIPFTAGFAVRRWKYALLLPPMVVCIILTLPSASREMTSGGPAGKVVEPNTILRTAPETVGKSVGVRLRDWAVVLRTVQDRPLLGSGPNTLKHTFTGYQTVAQTNPNLRHDKAHNEFLEVVSTMGLMGLGAYLWMLAALGWRLAQCLRRNWGSPSAWVSAGTLLAFLAYVGQSLMVFHTVAAYATFWLVLALGLGMTDASGFRHSVSRRTILKPILVTAGVVGGSAMLFLGYLSVRPLVADAYFLKADNMRPSTRAEVLQKLLWGDRALAYNAYEPLYVTTHIVDLAEASNYSSDPEFNVRVLGRAVELADAAIDVSPYDANLYFVRALARYYGGSSSDPVMLSDLEKAVELYPNYFQANLLLAETYKRRGYHRQAIAARQAALRVLPDHGRAVFALGDDYYSAGRYQEAIDTWEKARGLIPKESLVYLALGTAYEERGDRRRARENFEIALKLKPDQPGVRERLEKLR